MNRRRALLTVMGKSAPSVVYILKDEFTTDESAPLTSPRICEPGPGNLLIYDSGTNISITNGKIALTAPGTWTGATVKKTTSVSPHCGRVFLADVNHSINHYINESLALYPDNTNAGGVNVASIIRNGANLQVDFYTIDGLPLQYLSTASPFTLNQTLTLAIVERASGYYFLAKGGGYAGWRLFFETAQYTPGNLFPGFSLNTGAFTVDNFQCGDWGDVWSSQYGLATDRKAVTGVGDSIATTASFLAEFTVNSMKDGDVLNIVFRATDVDNCWIVRATKAALNAVVTLQLISKASGVETVQATTTCYYCSELYPRTFRLYVDGNTIQAFLFTDEQTTYSASYTLASFNAGVTGLSVDWIGKELVSYPFDVSTFVPSSFQVAAGAPTSRDICYEGGSITYGMSAYPATKCYANQSALICDSLVSLTTRLTHHNNGVPSTGSDRALANLSTEVYPHNPSLVFIEFCVNDGVLTAQTSGEALIREIRTNLPNTNIAMIFMPQATSTSDPTNVKDATLQVYKALCSHYSIPYVDMAAELVRAVGAGEYTITQYTSDLTHPTTFGHMKATQLLSTILTKELVEGGTQTGALPAPLY